MAETLYTQLPVAVGLDGTEVVPIDKSDGMGGYTTSRTTTGAIADIRDINSLLPPQAGNAGKVLSTDGIDPFWLATGGVGTVTSVGLSLPAEMSVSGSPVVAAGTLTATWATQSANRVFAGPTSGVASTPGFRALVGADLPNPSATTLGGVESYAAVTHQFLTSISTSGVPASAQPAAADLSDGTTGTGAVVLAGSPALTGTPTFAGSSSGTTGLKASATASGTLTLPAATDTLIGKATTDTLTNKTYDTAGTGNSFKINGTAITAVTGSGSVVLATSPTLVTPALGTPSSGTLTNCTGYVVGNISGLGTGVATFLATPSSANLAAAVTDETGSGALVFATSPALVTPTLGVASATSINKVAITAPAASATLTIANTKTLTVSNTLTLAGTDSTTMTFPGTSSTVLTTGNSATITVGYGITPYSGGTVSSGTYTPAFANGNYQYYTNNGAHTLAAPANDCAIDILVTNSASAGAITFSGFTVGAATGSPLTTTSTSKFIISIRRVNAVATYSVYALQ